MRFAPLFAVVGALSLSAPALANPASQPCIHDALGNVFAEGFVTHSVRATTMEAGATQQFSVTLRAGDEYAIQSCGEATDFELMLYDGEGKVVARGQDVAGVAQLAFTPTTTQRYHVVAYARPTVAAAPRQLAVALAYR